MSVQIPHDTPAHKPASAPPALNPLVDLHRAAEFRDANGDRRYGSVATLRRRANDGSLPHERHGAKIMARLADLEVLEHANSTDPATKENAELLLAARRRAAAAPPVPFELIEQVTSALRGGVSA